MDADVVEARPPTSSVDRLRFIRADGARLAPFGDGTVESISSLHAVEHFGLGRYGDPIDPNACHDAMRSFVRVLKPGGWLYFSVPIGSERLEFNAQRVFAPHTMIKSLNDLDMRSFSAVDDQGDLVTD